MRTNFSKDTQEIFDLAIDLARCDFQLSGDLKKSDLEADLRDRINNEILGGKSLYQAYRANKNTIFEIVEEIVNVAIGENIIDSAFMDAFVEVKNRNLGDETEFYAEGGLLSAARFAGNHWDTNRQALDMGEVIKLPREWVYVNLYDDLERFIKGVASLDKIVDKVYKAMNKYIQDRLYAQFVTVATAVPSDFTANCNSEDAVGKLCDLVQAAGGYNELTIAGTKGALRKLAGMIPDKMFANSQKEAKATTGSIGDWEGNKLMIIPQTLKSGTFELALADNQLFIFGGDTKPIKLEIVGDTRTMDKTESTANNDMSIELQVQTKVGMGLVLPEYFGVATLV